MPSRRSVRLATGDRPREKLERAGTGALGTHELLGLVIGHGVAGRDALGIAELVLESVGGLHGLVRVRGGQLARVPGLGAAGAARIVAAVELGRRTLVRPAPDRPRFLTAGDVAEYLLPRYGVHPVEQFGVVLLDTRQRLIKVQVISVGSVDASVAHPREVFREATMAGASMIIAFHNHPSGDPSPSVEDVALTERLRQAGDVLGITLLDHVILADTTFCSLRESRCL
jgi:DNA repair protein RadC